jgi:hypothetical protein
LRPIRPEVVMSMAASLVPAQLVRQLVIRLHFPMGGTTE